MTLQQPRPDLETVSRKVTEALSAGYLDPIIWYAEQEIERMGAPMEIQDEMWPLKRAKRDGEVAALQKLLSWINQMAETSKEQSPEGA